MPITVKSGATWSSTGGSDLVFTGDGRPVADGINMVVTADTNLLLRRMLVLKATNPAMPAKSGEYAKLGRASLVYKVPFIAADGKLYSQPQRIEMAFHPEYLVASRNGVINDMTAFIADSDFTAFWQNLLIPSP